MRMMLVLCTAYAILFLAGIAPAAAATHGFCVHLIQDQVGINDATHTRVLFDTSHAIKEFDTDNEWDLTHSAFNPSFTTPHIVTFSWGLSWTPPAGVVHSVLGGYGKSWVHLQSMSLATDLGFGEGAIDGPLSAANARMQGTMDVMVTPNIQDPVMVHLAVELFSGQNGHAIQSGSVDVPQDTPRRSFICGHWTD
jgi:hypothetical protein